MSRARNKNLPDILKNKVSSKGDRSILDPILKLLTVGILSYLFEYHPCISFFFLNLNRLLRNYRLNNPNRDIRLLLGTIRQTFINSVL